MDDIRFASRKFVLTLGVILTNSFFLYAKVLEAKDYTTLVIAVLGLYFTGNVIEKFKIESKG